jgi:hypothetical protein
MRYELNQKSEIVEFNGDVQFIDNKKDVLTKLFSQDVYECIEINNDGCEWDISYKNKVTNEIKKIVVYYGNIRNEDRNNREKKIQLNGKDPRNIRKECIILGLYCFDKNDKLEDLVLAGWNVDQNTNYPSNPSIRGLNIDVLQKARFEGLYRNQFRNNIVCTFKPEFLFYYIENKNVIHNENFEIVGDSTSLSENQETSHQIIFFGSPGTGKSREIDNLTSGSNRIRTTFHPETDYQSFVGSYKPIMTSDNSIKYGFVPQSFTLSYCNAWSNPESPYYLLIEEINRGNCAQIFGDLFQCLDRGENGYSKYEIQCDKDFSNYLKEYFEKLDNEEILSKYKEVTKSNDYDKIVFPSNLYIYATMNTSDQSLFPMDSAFKRRWDWKYVSINYDDAKSFTIEIDDTKYNWGDFINKINPKIKEITGSEDKQLGNRFVNPANKIISLEQFKSKVLFYLWSEIYKDEFGTQNSIFKYFDDNDSPVDFQFGDLYNSNSDHLIKSFLLFNGISSEV